MRHLVVDYLQRHPVTLGFVFVGSLVWGINAQDLTVFSQGLLIVQIIVLGFCGFTIDPSEGTREVLRVLPLSARQVMKTYWFIWVFVGPVAAYGGYFLGTLMGVLFGSHPIFDGRMLIFGLEALIYMGSMSWSTFAVIGDPTRKNWSKGLLGSIVGFAWLGSFFIPNEWLRVICEDSPSSILPVILICGVVSFLLSPPVQISGPSLSRPRERDNSEKSVEAPIVFPSLRALLFRSLMNRLLLAPMVVGILFVLVIGLHVLFPGNRNSLSGDNTDRILNTIINGMLVQLFLSLFLHDRGIRCCLRGLRVLPFRTNLLALVMTVYPLDQWVSLGFGFTIVFVVLDKWTLLPDFLPIVIVIGGVSSLFTALIMNYDRNQVIELGAIPLLVINLGAIATPLLVFLAGQVGLFGLTPCMASPLVALVSLVLAYAVNRNSLLHNSAVYHSRVVFGQPQQAPRWQAGG